MTEQVLPVTSDEEIMACFAIVKQLHAHLKQAEFLPTIRHMMSSHYQMVCIKNESQVVAVAGFRIVHSLWGGKHLHLEDLVCDAKHRSQGHGKTLLLWLTEHAKANQCAFIGLDTVVQATDSHRFYRREGMDVACFHFQKVLKD